MSLRIIIIEDEMLIALELEAMLNDLGYKVVAVVGRLPDAIDAVSADGFDVAIVDLRLGSKDCSPVIDRLQIIGKPFVITTGYERDEVAARYVQPVLSKPYDGARLCEVLETFRK